MALISNIRALFSLTKGLVGGLPELHAEADPFHLFARWFGDAKRVGILLPDAMSVATATRDGVPSARMCLLKDHGPEGFVFYTNYESRKARELEENPNAALVIHWPALQRQIRIEGTTERVSEETSTAYFRSRPRGSRIAAWASKQSAPIDSRAELEARYRQLENKFGARDVERPEFWGGYRLTPRRIEFWQGRLNRLHDRLLYTHVGEGWHVERLQP
jgi:pyridoxamine 5'-phosphate oxidase